MRTIKAFQTSDGKIHQTEVGALKAEFRIALRGALQSSISTPRGDTILISDACEAIARNPEVFTKIISDNRRRISGAVARADRSRVTVTLA